MSAFKQVKNKGEDARVVTDTNVHSIRIEHGDRVFYIEPWGEGLIVTDGNPSADLEARYQGPNSLRIVNL